MLRRQALYWIAGGAVAAGAGVQTIGVRRIHHAPRQTPFLTDEHLASLLALPRGLPRVLFIGNSMVLNHDVPARMAAIAARDGVELTTAMGAAHGARLVETIRIAALTDVLTAGWDAVVIQDFTKSPLRRVDRWGSDYAMLWIAQAADVSRVVLFPPWPAEAGNSVYTDAGRFTRTPDNPRQFADISTHFYTGIARRYGFAVAPIPHSWLDATESGAKLYAADGHHANEAGADFAAQAIWTSLKNLL